MVLDYQRLLRENWQRRGIDAFVQEFVKMLESAPPTSGDTGVATDTTQAVANNVFSGTVVSGTGSDHVIRLDTGDLVVATVPGILATESIPAGATGVTIRNTDGSYTFHFPLWVSS